MKHQIVAEGIILLLCLAMIILSEYCDYPDWVMRLVYIVIFILSMVRLLFLWRKKE